MQWIEAFEDSVWAINVQLVIHVSSFEYYIWYDIFIFVFHLFMYLYTHILKIYKKKANKNNIWGPCCDKNNIDTFLSSIYGLSFPFPLQTYLINSSVFLPQATLYKSSGKTSFLFLFFIIVCIFLDILNFCDLDKTCILKKNRGMVGYIITIILWFRSNSPSGIYFTITLF